MSYRRGMRSLRSTAALAALTAALAGAGALGLSGGLLAARRMRRLAPTRGTSGLSVPFRAGETLEYAIGYLGMREAATAELKVLPRLEFYGDAAWHFQATAHSLNPLRYVMALDDQFDSYAGAQALATRQYELYLHENGKDSARKFALNARTPGAETISAPAGTRDPLAALYALRANDWSRAPEMRAPIFDGSHFYDMTARIAARNDSVAVPAGTFRATRIAIRVASRDSGEAMQFTLWLAQNPARTPVEVDADVPVGTVQAMLLRSE